MRMNKIVLLRGVRPRARRQRGFTLIELVIAMVIASILAAIAIPSYTSYIMKSRRTEAKSALLNLASLEERFFSTNNTYSALPTDLGYTAGAGVSFPVGSGYYNITALTVTPAAAPANTTSAGTPATYIITARPVPTSTQANDSGCTSFTITSGGVQTSTGSSTTCWQ
jgi:type IV pilus assembly protein PilE